MATLFRIRGQEAATRTEGLRTGGSQRPADEGAEAGGKAGECVPPPNSRRPDRGATVPGSQSKEDRQ